MADHHDLMTHRPLPYVVHLRAAASEDEPPVRHVKHLTAYSLIEAVLQASMEVTGSVDAKQTVIVESVRPDVAEWLRQLTAEEVAPCPRD